MAEYLVVDFSYSFSQLHKIGQKHNCGVSGQGEEETGLLEERN